MSWWDFRGETHNAFESTCSLLEQLPVTYLHVFPFSPRKGTPAANFDGQVDDTVVKERAKCIRKLGERKKADFHQRQHGRRVPILIESKRDRGTGRLKGLTSNYIPVLVDGADSLVNKLVTVELRSTRDGRTMTGHRVQETGGDKRT